MGRKDSQPEPPTPPIIDVGRFIGMVKHLRERSVNEAVVRNEISEVGSYANRYYFLTTYAKTLRVDTHQGSDVSLLRHILGPLKLYWFEQLVRSGKYSWNSAVDSWQIWLSDPCSLAPLSLIEARHGETCFAKLHKDKHPKHGGITYNGGLVVSGSLVHKQERAWVCRTSASTWGEPEQVEVGRWDSGARRWCSVYRIYSVDIFDSSEAYDDLGDTMVNVLSRGQNLGDLSIEHQNIIQRMEILFLTHRLSAEVCREVKADLEAWVRDGRHPRLDASPDSPPCGSIALGPSLNGDGVRSYWYVLASAQISPRDSSKDLVLVCKISEKQIEKRFLTSFNKREFRENGIVRIEADHEGVNFPDSLRRPAHIDVSLVRTVLVNQLEHPTSATRYLAEVRSSFQRLVGV